MLTLKNVNKTFNADTINEKRALIDINLHLKEGDFVTVIGGNGSGKSTLLNIIAGVYPIDSGFTVCRSGYNIKEHMQSLLKSVQDPMRGTAGMSIVENLPWHTGAADRGLG